MAKRNNYIASPDHLKQSYARYQEFSCVDKVPVSRIKVDARLFSYPNPVYEGTVSDIIENFELDLWNPILVNDDFYLLDGQHRLQAARRMGLKYIDTVVQHIPNYSFYYGKPVKAIN